MAGGTVVEDTTTRWDRTGNTRPRYRRGARPGMMPELGAQAPPSMPSMRRRRSAAYAATRGPAS
eukprot:1701049-Lingulodinium_polyedra.AAC.1